MHDDNRRCRDRLSGFVFGNVPFERGQVVSLIPQGSRRRKPHEPIAFPFFRRLQANRKFFRLPLQALQTCPRVGRFFFADLQRVLTLKFGIYIEFFGLIFCRNSRSWLRFLSLGLCVFSQRRKLQKCNCCYEGTLNTQKQSHTRTPTEQLVKRHWSFSRTLSLLDSFHQLETPSPENASCFAAGINAIDAFRVSIAVVENVLCQVMRIGLLRSGHTFC